MKRQIVLIIFTIFLIGFISADVITVDDDGGADHLTIQAAIGNASAGDTIEVAPGTYAENLIIDKSLNLIGDSGNSTPGPGPDSPILDGEGEVGSAIIIEGGVSDVIIQGFEIKDYRNSGLSGGIGSGVIAWESIGTSDIEILDNYFHDLGWSAVLVGNEGQDLHSNWLVENNVIEDIAFYSIELTNTENSDVIKNIIKGGTVFAYTDATTEDSDDGILIQTQIHTGSGLTNSFITVEENIITGFFERAGIELLAWDSTDSLTAELNEIQIINNYVEAAARGIFVFSVGANADIDDVNISENILNFNDDGVHLIDFGGTHGFINIEKNSIINSLGPSSGIHLSSGTSADGVEVHYNYIVNNSLYGVNHEGSDTLNATLNWWGSCDGPDFPPYNLGTGDSIDNSSGGIVLFDPWIGVCINKTIVSCAHIDNNITLMANVTSLLDALDIDSIWFSYTFENGTNYNKTALNVGGTNYSITIPSYELRAEENITWNVFARDSFGFEFSNGLKTFYVRNSTHLGIDPWPADGLNDWWITEPEFTLTPDPIGDEDNISYRWDSANTSAYSGPFGLEDIPNAPPVESAGILELNWWTDFGCGDEPLQTYTLKVDLVDPNITNLHPYDGEIVYNNFKPTISAYLDEVYQSNSGINKSSVIVKLDGNITPANVSAADGLDAIVNFTPNLSLGVHEVTINVSDNAGRNSSRTWSFEIKETPAFSMMVYSPVDGIYGERRIPFNISLGGEVELLEYIDYNTSRPRWRTICRNCDEYGFSGIRERTKNFRDGEHLIGIRAIDSFGQDEENISILVDNRDPRISRTEPRRNRATNGSNFYIRFREENVKELLLIFNPEINLTENISDDCEESRRTIECYFDISSELIPYDGTEIEYYFNLTDIANSSDASRPTKVLVDTTKPIIDFFNYSIDRRRVEFIFNITEGNFDEINYIDWNDRRPRERRLCSRLDNEGVCERTKSFREGKRNLTIKVMDEAGNIDEIKDIIFEIIR